MPAAPVLSALCLLLLPLAAAADAARQTPSEPPQDRWHQVTHISPFFSPGTADLRMAAVIQSDGYFARLILGEGDQGAYVTVNLPGTTPAASLRSDLVYSNGGVMTRTVRGEDLDAQVMTSSDTVTYSFTIAREDIRGFRLATSWTLTPEGADPFQITLKGSSKAIRAARSDPRPLTAPAAETDPTLDPRRASYAKLPIAAQ